MATSREPRSSCWVGGSGEGRSMYAGRVGVALFLFFAWTNFFANPFLPQFCWVGVCTCVYACVCACMRACVCVCVRACACVCMCACVRFMLNCVHACMHACAVHVCVRACVQKLCVCACPCESKSQFFRKTAVRKLCVRACKTVRACLHMSRSHSFSRARTISISMHPEVLV